METGIKIGDIMTRDFISVNPDTSIIDCARKMMKKRVGSLILKEKGQLKGIITERDIIWAMTKKSKKDLKEIKAGDIAPRKTATIKPAADLYQALQKMRKTKHRRLPVVVKGRVVGLLTIKDVLRIEPSLFDTASEIIQLKQARKFPFKFPKPKLKFWERDREGVCDECGNFDMLYKIDNRLICESCKDVL